MTAPDLRVRPAAAADRPALGRLGALLMQVHHGFDPDRFIAPGPDAARGYGAFLVGELENPDAVVLVGEDPAAPDSPVVGYVYGALEGQDWMTLRGPAGVIYDLAVDPDRRRAGVGRALLEAMAAALTARGAPRLLLHAAHRNETAQRLFAAAGFRPTMVEMTRERDAQP